MKKENKNIWIKDLSLWILIFSNIVTIFFAINENWEISTLMWVYWFQSMTIGIFNFIRILQLKEFSTEKFKINDQPAQPTQGTKVFTAFFFLFHFGFFHFIYLIFLLDKETLNYGDLKYVLITSLIFFFNHLFSYSYNRPRDTKKQNISNLMFYPYARIIPMHLTIILSSSLNKILIVFLILKTIADVIMHIIINNVIKKAEEQTQPA